MTPPPTAVDTAQVVATWRALAPLLAGRDRVRISRDGGRNYHRRWERALTDELPNQPAAVPLYTSSGECRVLVIDLDTSKGGVNAVHRDAATITDLVYCCGGRVIRDHSPNGGVHLYIPLHRPIGFHDARDLALALATRTTTMDATPNHNITDGLIRPPGARHRTGGHQTLDGSLDAAHHLARTGNPAGLVAALQHQLRAELTDLAHRVSEPTPPPPDDIRAGTPRELTAAYAHIARTGSYDPDRYATPSEARQAVITSAAAAGYTATDIQHRVLNGTWPGLAALYARYRPTTRLAAITRDHRKAQHWLTSRPHGTQPTQIDVHRSHTSELFSHRAANPSADSSAQLTDYHWIREWETALRLTELERYPGRAGHTIRFLLRALAEAARKRGSRHIDFGVRSLAVATGLDHGTVARHLSRLRTEAEPLVRLTRDHHALDADQYELVIPSDTQDRANSRPWRGGKTHALRSAFRELGHVAALVYEAIEHSPTAIGATALVEQTRISRAGMHEALETLAAFGLIDRDARGLWRRNTAASLSELAEQLGCTDAVHQQLTRYSIERALWRTLVLSGRYLTAEVILDYTGGWIPWPEAPPDDETTLFDLVTR